MKSPAQIIRTAVLAFAGVLLLSAPPRAQTVSDVSFHAGGFLQLVCFSPVSFNVSQAQLAAIFSGGTGDDAITTGFGTMSVTASSGELTGSFTGLDTSLNNDPTAIFGSFLGCGVRGNGLGGGVQVDAALSGSPHLSGPGTGQVLVDNVGVRLNGSGGAYVSSFVIPEASMSFSSFTLIDTRIEFDLSGVDQAGNYSSGAGGSYTITVTAL